MSICKNCGAECLEQATFCTQCGTQLTEAQSQPQAETAAPVYESTPTYTYAAPVDETSSKVPAILGMILGISAAFLSFIMMIVISVESASTYSYYGYYYSAYDAEELLATFFGFAIFTIPCTVVGLIMSFKATSCKAMAIVGKITSFVAIGLMTLSFLIALSV